MYLIFYTRLPNMYKSQILPPLTRPLIILFKTACKSPNKPVTSYLTNLMRLLILTLKSAALWRLFPPSISFQKYDLITSVRPVCSLFSQTCLRVSSDELTRPHTMPRYRIETQNCPPYLYMCFYLFPIFISLKYERFRFINDKYWPVQNGKCERKYLKRNILLTICALKKSEIILALVEL